MDERERVQELERRARVHDPWIVRVSAAAHKRPVTERGSETFAPGRNQRPERAQRLAQFGIDGRPPRELGIEQGEDAVVDVTSERLQARRYRRYARGGIRRGHSGNRTVHRHCGAQRPRRYDPYVADFLSPEWIAGLDTIARSAEELSDASDHPVVIEQQVIDDRGTTTTYHLVLGPGPARVNPGSAGHADLTLVATEAAARGIRDGTANAQRCLADGTLRLRGNPEVLTRQVDVLARVGDLFGATRR